MCIAFSLRFHLPDEALLVLISMFKLCAGSEFENISTSMYTMSKCFSSQSQLVTYHYYCKCMKELIYSVNAIQKVKKYLATCKKCNEQSRITSGSQNYFITIDLEHQLKIFLSNKTVFTDILKNVEVHENSVNDSNASSHFKGTIHENIIKCNRGNAETILLTFNSNIDGAPLTKSV